MKQDAIGARRDGGGGGVLVAAVAATVAALILGISAVAGAHPDTHSGRGHAHDGYLYHTHLNSDDHTNLPTWTDTEQDAPTPWVRTAEYERLIRQWCNSPTVSGSTIGVSNFRAQWTVPLGTCQYEVEYTYHPYTGQPTIGEGRGWHWPYTIDTSITRTQLLSTTSANFHTNSGVGYFQSSIPAGRRIISLRVRATNGSDAPFASDSAHSSHDAPRSLTPDQARQNHANLCFWRGGGTGRTVPVCLNLPTTTTTMP